MLKMQIVHTKTTNVHSVFILGKTWNNSIHYRFCLLNLNMEEDGRTTNQFTLQREGMYMIHIII